MALCLQWWQLLLIGVIYTNRFSRCSFLVKFTCKSQSMHVTLLSTQLSILTILLTSLYEWFSYHFTLSCAKSVCNVSREFHVIHSGCRSYLWGSRYPARPWQIDWQLASPPSIVGGRLTARFCHIELTFMTDPLRAAMESNCDLNNTRNSTDKACLFWTDLVLRIIKWTLKEGTWPWNWTWFCMFYSRLPREEEASFYHSHIGNNSKIFTPLSYLFCI